MSEAIVQAAREWATARQAFIAADIAKGKLGAAVSRLASAECALRDAVGSPLSKPE